MKKLVIKFTALMLTTLVSQASFALSADTVASVNGVKITQKQYEQQLKLRSAQSRQGRQAPINRQVILDELINREILLQEAKKQKLNKNKQVLAQIENQKNNILIQALISRSPAVQPVTDKELKAIYDQQIKHADPTEYKASHILVKDEAAAKNIIKKLNDGAKFEDLAKTESVDASAKEGGDLGWFSAERMPPEFASAIKSMKKGTYSQTPVKTQFGWHIIKLDDSHKRELPKFEAVKNQIVPLVQNKRLQEYVLKLRSKAKIEIK
jgi:peptidyl-prolyl cis-trans isomerase C